MIESLKCSKSSYCPTDLTDFTDIISAYPCNPWEI